ncbi:hypothetical protein D9756_008676 [Leucocoprinus leucothites]|uniref:SUZ domain-containing protein n=1 Tax=Leucocoprinus leucothites TaxID=201217 RepID=A0A8H5FVT1_9AGAR|nr:hypothetical protein D9756_008676 [Leucoagaricus leucothites]
MATSLNSSSKPPLDAWDYQTNTNPSRKPVVTPAQVRDDWEDDDDDENDVKGTEELKEELSPSSSPKNRVHALPVEEGTNKKIWEAANSQDSAPMPALLSSRTGSVIPPPAGAFQPAMRILKRPQSSSSSASQGSPATSPPPTGESLHEREARYAAARERIFGLDGSDESVATSPKLSNNVKIIREPKAPDSAPGKQQAQSAGFRGRGGKTASATRPPVDS